MMSDMLRMMYVRIDKMMTDDGDDDDEMYDMTLQ